MNERDERAERDKLATVIETAYDLNPGMASFELLAHAILAAGYRKPRTITTMEELDALPDGVLILTEQGGYWESIKRMDGKNWWKEPGATFVSPSSDLTLPVTVLHEPEPLP